MNTSIGRSVCWLSTLGYISLLSYTTVGHFSFLLSLTVCVGISRINYWHYLIFFLVILLYAELLRMQNKYSECISLVETYLADPRLMSIFDKDVYLLKVREGIVDDEKQARCILKVASR